MMERFPGFGFDSAIVALSDVRNLRRDTREPVSLDEVHFHHFDFLPLCALGAEMLSPLAPRPLIAFAPGYAFLIEKDRHFSIAAHVLSNADLAPIDGSLALARKHCNECYCTSSFSCERQGARNRSSSHLPNTPCLV
jgi:hypothetical protein